MKHLGRLTLLALALIANTACERHEWNDTKHFHEPHGHGHSDHAAHGDHGADHGHAAKEAPKAH